MKLGQFTLAVILVNAFGSSAIASGSFDGNYSGTDCYSAGVTIKVIDGIANYHSLNHASVIDITGQVSDTGSVKFGSITGNFSGDKFSGFYMGQEVRGYPGRPCPVSAERTR